MNPYDPPLGPVDAPRARALRAPRPPLVAAIFGVSGVILSYPFINALLTFNFCAPSDPEPDPIARQLWTVTAAIASSLAPALAFGVLRGAARWWLGRLGLSLLGTWLAVVGMFVAGALLAALEGPGSAGEAIWFGARLGAFSGIGFCILGVIPWIILEIILRASARAP